MAGKLDDVSTSIGRLEANFENLNHTFEKHCDDDDRRHLENLAALKSIERQMETLNETLKGVVARVGVIGPIVDGYQISQWKMAGAISLAATILGGVGWLITTFAIELVRWIIARIH